MPFPILPFLFRKRKQIPILPPPNTVTTDLHSSLVKRHFYNEAGFQTYASFFAHWEGIITAGHVMTECSNQLPPFANGHMRCWPSGLDAALLGCKLPKNCPPNPKPSQMVTCIGYPAGSSHPSHREAQVYIQRPNTQDVWIARIITPDEPVVTGMSGGVVMNQNKQPIGVLITRNSPADLNNDRDPDESFDFVSLAGIWRAIMQEESFV